VISVESRKVFPPLVFCAPAERVSLGIGYRRWRVKKTRMVVLLGRQSSLVISLIIWIQCINVTDRRTDRHRATAKTALMHSIVR